MENLKDKNLGFFMNYFSSLQIWDKFGMFRREILLYNSLAKEFNKIYIFTYGDMKELDYAQYFEKNVIIVPKKFKIPDVIYEFLLPFVRRKYIKECDIFKTNQNSGAIAPTIAKIIYRKKLIVRSGYVGSDFAKLNSWPLYAKLYFWFAENFSYYFCDQAFVPTQKGYNYLIKKYKFLKNKLMMMNNFVDVDFFRRKDQDKKYDIIYVARLDGKQKNHRGLLEAAEGLILKILFIGQGTEKINILDEAKKRNIDLQLKEMVPHQEIADYYNSARMCVFPSLFEGNPKALLEAMSCELPVVAFNVPGISNLIRNGETGLISAVDSDIMRDNIQRIIRDRTLAERLGKNARQFIMDNFSFKRLLTKEIEVYKFLLKK